MGEWLALSDNGILPNSNGQETLDCAMFVAEIALPLDPAVVLLKWQSTTGPARTFSIFYEETLGIVIVHRQEGQVFRHVMTGPVPEGHGVARLSYAYDCNKQSWRMELEKMGDGRASRLFSFGRNCHPLYIKDIASLVQGGYGTGRNDATLWFGIVKGNDIPTTGPWVGLRTPIPTQRGSVMAAHLLAGDRVKGLSGDWATVTRMDIESIPSCGSFAPMLLRAPFFGLRQDILVSADTHLAISNVETEYLFDSDLVYVEVGHLADGHRAAADNRRPVTQVARIELDQDLLVDVAGAKLFLSADNLHSVPKLRRFETHTLVSMSRDQGARRGF